MCTKCSPALRLFLLAILTCLGDSEATAFAAVPPLEGHVTDPSRKLKAADEEALEDKLGKIMTDTQCDLATWLSDVPPESANEAGADAYDRWHIGRDWENGILLVFPSTGPVHVIVKTERPAVTEAEITKVETGDDPHLAWKARIERAADELASVLRVGAKAAKVRPPGHGDPQRGLRYALGGAFVGLLAIGLSTARRIAARSSMPRAG